MKRTSGLEGEGYIYDGLTCNQVKVIPDLQEIGFKKDIEEQLFAVSRFANPYAKMLAEYFSSEDKEPRVLQGRQGHGKTLSYMEALIDIISRNPKLLPTAVIYQNSKQRSLLEHRKLAYEKNWGNTRLNIIDAHKDSIAEMLAVSDINIFDDMGYIFQDTIDGTYPLEELNRNLEEILNHVDKGKKVVIVTDNPFGVYAEKLELEYRDKGLPMEGVKKLNDFLPKFGYRNPLHRFEYTDVNHMVSIEVVPEAFVSRMNRLFRKNGIRVSEAEFIEDGKILESMNGLGYIYQQIANPRKFINMTNHLLQMAINSKKNVANEITSIDTDEIFKVLKSYGIDVNIRKSFGRHDDDYPARVRIAIKIEPVKKQQENN